MVPTCSYSYEHAWDILVKTSQHRGSKDSRKRVIKTLERCVHLIDEKNDYSFLHQIRFHDADKDAFHAAATFLFYETYFNATLLEPFALFLRDAFLANPLLFYDKDEVLSHTISIEDLFTLLLSLENSLQVSTIERISNEKGVREALLLALKDNDYELFVSSIANNYETARHLGSFLSIYKEVLNLNSSGDITRADYISLLSHAQFFAPNTIESPLPVFEVLNPTLFDGYLTSNNCIEKFINTYTNEHSFFQLCAPMLFAFRDFRGDIIFQDALSLFHTDNGIFFQLTKWLKNIGVLHLFINNHNNTVEDSKETDTPSPVRSGLTPLPKPKLLQTEQRGNSVYKSLFRFLVKKGFLRKDDEVFFAYLLGISNAYPLLLNRVVWFGDKWELKCLMEVLYPNRRPKEKPDYGDMSQIFCDKNGEKINLKDTPLQCRKKTINDPVQAAREEALIREFQSLLGAL